MGRGRVEDPGAREPTVSARIAWLAPALTVCCSAIAPASAQFAPLPFPLIVVPPPAQNIVVPKPRSETPRPAPEPPNPPAQREQQCRYQGQTRVCD